MTCWGRLRLKVGCCVGSSSGAVVLIQVGLEGAGSRAVLRLVAEGSSSTGHEVIVVFLDTCLALLHAPEDKGDAAEEQSTSDTSNDATNDLFVGFTDAAVTAFVVALLLCGSLGKRDLSGGGDRGAGTSRGLGDLLAGTHCDNGGGKLAQGGGQEIRGPRDWRSPPGGRGRLGRSRCICSGACRRGGGIVIVIIIVVVIACGRGWGWGVCGGVV
jgi:hypothetical protein